jgi:uncharacterized protein (DUF1501 family)
MKNVVLSVNGRANCEGVSRRDLLRTGTLPFFGLTLPQLLALRAEAKDRRSRADSVILLWLAGGPSHLDTFDPKPEAPTEIRGEFGAIDTAADGIQLSEHLPLTAAVMNRVALVRSVASSIAAHDQASQYMLTGYRPIPTLAYPSYGAVAARELGSRNHLPPYVGIPNAGRAGQSGFLGAGYSAFVAGNPAQRNFQVRDVAPARTVSPERLERRRRFAERLGEQFAAEVAHPDVPATNQFYEQAFDLINSSRARDAFDLQQESDADRERYGATALGQGALLARRLVEAGSRFVTVSRGGWDTHQNNFRTLAERLLPELDRGYSALVSDLHDRGMLDRTLVILMGEFGRTPRVNARGGRDHWARCRTVALAGAGIRGGQAIGKSDEQAGAPAERPVMVEDLAATLYEALGIDPAKQYVTPTGRPVALGAGGRPVQELW